MNWQRSAIFLIILGLLHNVLRLFTWWQTGSANAFNYVVPLYKIYFRSATSTEITCTCVAALAYILFAVWWTKLSKNLRWPQRSGYIGNSIFAALFVTLPLLVVTVLLGVVLAKTYGFALFMFLPFAAGFVNVSVTTLYERITWGQAMVSSCIALAVCAGGLMLFAIEGAVCIVMAAPIAFPIAAMGGILAHSVMPSRRSPAPMMLLLGITPFTPDIEHLVQPKPTLFEVTTSIEFDAPQSKVWQTVLQPAQPSKPKDLLFRAGVAYPLASHIEGTGSTATRYCDFSTGKLIEPVLLWQEPNQLRFRVASNPLPMQEWTPYAQIHPPHLDGFLVSKQGEFRLTALSATRTRLDATTWYEHNLYPEQYWRLWSDHIIHKVHKVVLEDIRQRSK